MDILQSLNEEQRNALLCVDGAVLVSAGAGSGKTRLLTHRIAYLVKDLNVSPYNILAITFTNKAANEMRTRVEKIVDGGSSIWISTFHSMCVRILRQDISHLEGYNRNFTIFSDTDSEKAVKMILKERGLEDEEVKKYLFHISNRKNMNLTINAYEDAYKFERNITDIVIILNAYEEYLKKCNALDFDDLLIKTYDLLKFNPQVLEYYSRRFKYILVDEFQDTNTVQYELVKLLSSYHKNLFVVGDEDQCIYTWRGADFKNIFNFQNDFENVKMFKLEKNYRSTKNILNIANTLIKNNNSRFDKNLYTENSDGVNPEYFQVYDEQEEAENVAGKIYSLVRHNNYKYSDIAILMRLNALTLPFEEKLLGYNIPHKIYGGFKFYERAEVKNVLSYLRLFINPKDEVSLLRIINFPKRAIGDSAVAKIKDLALQHDKSMLEIVLNIADYESSAFANKFKSFNYTYLDLLNDYNNLPLEEFAFAVVDKFNIKNGYPNTNEDNLDKILNIDSLLNSIKEFAEKNEGATLSDYLESVTLVSDLDNINTEDNVTVATVHAVKGLEFKVVFVIGLEENVFPIMRAMNSDSDMEEERRLMYVAITRAEERLFVSSCKTRFLYGHRSYMKESRFLNECELTFPRPKFNYEKEYTGGNNYSEGENSSYFSKASNKYNSSFAPFLPKANKKPETFDLSEKEENTTKKLVLVVGNQVGHPKFGVGKVKSITSDGKCADIDFIGIGTKTLMLEIAPLKLLKNGD